MKSATYKEEDIFSSISENKKDTSMTVPDEICKKIGWNPGDVLSVSFDEKGRIMIKRLLNE